MAMTNSIDRIRVQMAQVAVQKDALKPRRDFKIQPAGIENPAQFQTDLQPFLSFETKFLDSFHTGGTVVNQINIAKHIMADLQNCFGVVILRMCNEGRSFKLYYRGTTPCDSSESYLTSDFECIEEILSVKEPVVHDDETSKQLTILCQWKPLFSYIPDLVVGIPVFIVSGDICAIVALAFKRKFPKGFLDKKLPILKDVLEILVPYALNNQGIVDNREDVARIQRVLTSIENVEKVMSGHTSDVDSSLSQIGQEISHLGNCKNLVVFMIDTGDNILRKYYTHFGTSGKSSCPDKKIHSRTELPMTDKDIPALVYVATHKKGLKVNESTDFTDYGIQTKHIHSIGNCTCRCMLVAPIVDYSGECALVVELTDKEGGFSPTDFETVLLFCQHTACLLTCTVLLDRREKNHRRRNIITEMLCNISFVKHTNVEQFISQHRKTSKVFKGNFDEFTLCVRLFPENDIAGISLETFYELNIVNEFKIRRSVLIRFILSVQQGYGSLPYHNWYHAVSVSHYVYLLIRKLKLVEQGHINKLEAFALVVSALCHDIDHRGTNNQFQSYTNSDIYKLYAVEDSVMERHHLAIALAILHREDCNILESFNDADYKYFVELLTWNIIATDISKHLKTRENLYLEARSGNPKQRKMARLSLFMTAADLCDNVKKWDDNLPTVRGILQEFFSQGDMERQLGFTPIAMMDRNVAYVPMIEYKFVKYIVAPVYRNLTDLYVEMKPCLTNILHNEDLWTLATVVYDKFRDSMDQLDILDLSAMKEDELMRIKLDEPLDKVKLRRFSAVIPPLPPTIPVPLVEKKSTLLNINAHALNEEDDLEEVDTGEKTKRCRCTLFCGCCFCCSRNK